MSRVQTDQLAPARAVDWLRTCQEKGPQALHRTHLRWQRPSVAPASLHMIAVDLSGSMWRDGRLAWAKAFAARLIDEAARAGEQIALLTFGGQGVQVVHAPGPARRSAIERIRPLGGGGGTPLAACLQQVQCLLQNHRRRHGPGDKVLWLLTDGRTLEQPEPPPAANRTVIVNFDDGRQGLGRCAQWALRWGAELRQGPAAEHFSEANTFHRQP